jgi:transposase InsO family protein
MERIAADIVGEFKTTKNGNKCILVVSDYFTKWVEAYAVPQQTAYEIAEKVVTEFICRLGCPRQFHSDLGPGFRAHLMKEVNRLLEINKTQTSPYRPCSDGLVERFNKTMQQMLKCFVNEWKTNWDDALPYVMMAYRATEQESTGCTPNMMMLGREVETPLDMMFEQPPRLDDPSMPNG